MPKELTTVEILKEAAGYFKGARQNLMAGAELLHKIKAEELWKGKHESFSEYLEEDCQISDGMASKLIQVWQFYVIEGGFRGEKMIGADIEKLYMAAKLKSSPEKALSQALTLTRQELKSELNDPDDTCKHPATYKVCTICHGRL